MKIEDYRIRLHTQKLKHRISVTERTETHATTHALTYVKVKELTQDIPVLLARAVKGCWCAVGVRLWHACVVRGGPTRLRWDCGGGAVSKVLVPSVRRATSTSWQVRKDESRVAPRLSLISRKMSGSRAGFLILSVLSCAHGLAPILRFAAVSRAAPVVMRKVDDTQRAAAAEAARLAEEERLAAEAAADPEPGLCPECKDVNTYWDGMVTFACTNCGHEWGIEEAKAAAEEDMVRDVNGAEINTGDQVILIKDLAKGSLKKGTKCKVRVGDFGDGHALESVIPSKGTYLLKSEFVKKAG